MISDTITASKARGQALQACIALLLVMMAGILKINLFGFEVGFLFTPLIVIFLWPRGADPVFTYVILFSLGLIYDWISGGPSGLWALLFLIAFVSVQPGQRPKEINLMEIWINFIIWMIVLLIVLMALDSLEVTQIAFRPLAIMTVINIMFFPLYIFARHSWRNILVGDDD
ncbi:MAG: hypothetical protein HKN36_09655 [Hellea sp.]|nr:hypothetical protein [Hellea sp.]